MALEGRARACYAVEMICHTCGHPVYHNSGGGDWDWPYACSYCDPDYKRLPEHLRAPERRADYVPYHPKPSVWGRIKQVFHG